jgi:hypothetical protein
MLGVAMRTLHEYPVLNAVHLADFDADSVLPDFFLNAFDQIKVTMVSTSLEELSKIWATINQPYRLSVAYEVSLVQIAPTPPPPVNGGIVLSTGVSVITLDAPRLVSLNPPQGALGRISGPAVVPNLLQVSGFGMSFPGQSPIARVGGQIAAIQTTPAPTDQSLTVSLPLDLEAGPEANVTVTLNGRTSTPLPFVVTPWISTLTPIRTPLAAPATLLLLRGSGFTATPQSVRFEGPGGTTTVAAFEPGGTDAEAQVTIPASLANGIYNVRLAVAGGNVSNARTLEVIPRLDTAAPAIVEVDGRQVHELTLSGERLAGSDVRLLIDDGTFEIGNNANAASITYTMGRLLGAGTHAVAVQVDGQRSHSVEMVV